MKTAKQFAIILLALVVSISAQAMSQTERATKGFTIRQGAAISVVEYQKDCDCFVVKIEAEPGVGPNITSTQWLLAALKSSIKPEEARRHPEKLMGQTVYHLQTELSLLSPDEIAQRTRKSSKPSKVKKTKRLPPQGEN